MHPRSATAPWRRPDVLVVAGFILASLAVVVIGSLAGEGAGGGHAVLHATTSAVLFGLGLVILVRRPRATLANRAPVIGLAAFGIGTLVEAIGAFGFVGDERTDLAIVHDLGLGLTQLGMIAAIAGGAIGLRALARRALPSGRLGGAVATTIGVVVFLGGMTVFATLVGFPPFLGS